MIANAAVALIGIGLLTIGALAIAAPETAALMFGVPTQTTEARAYVWATATRDVAIGCWFLVLLALRVSRQALGASLIVMALIPIGDFVNVYWTAGRSTMALLLHGGSSVLFLTLGLKQASAILRDAEKFHAQQKAFVNERLEPWTKS